MSPRNIAPVVPLLFLCLLVSWVVLCGGAFVPGIGCGTFKEISTVKSIPKGALLDDLECTVVEVCVPRSFLSPV